MRLGNEDREILLAKELMNPFQIVGISLDTLTEHKQASQSIFNASFFGGTESPAESQPCRYESADLSGTELYIGLSDSTVAHYTLEPLEVLNFQVNSHLKDRIVLGSPKLPCTNIRALPSENFLLAQNNALLHILRLGDLKQAFPPLRGIECFGADRTLTSPAELAVATKRSLSVYYLDEKLTLGKSVALQDSVVHICFADSKSYNLLSIKRDKIIPLFPYDSESLAPIIYSIGKGEFLLVTGSAQGFGIGVFVSSLGEPIRGTLQWPALPLAVIFHDPYVVAMLPNSTVQIHNIETQTLVQSIIIPSANIPKFMNVVSFPMDVTGEKNGGVLEIILGTGSEIFGLLMLPWDFQLMELFESNHIDQALLLLAKMSENEESLEQTQKRSQYYCRAAFAFFEKCDFQKAFLYFKKGGIAPTLVLLLFGLISEPMEEDDRVLSEAAKKTKAFATVVHEHVAGTVAADEGSRKELKEALESLAYHDLIEYLEDKRKSRAKQFWAVTVDNCLLQLYIQANPAKISAFLLGDNCCSLPFCESLLSKCGRHYLLSKLYKKLGQSEKVLELWVELSSGTITDSDFGGMLEIIEYLGNLSEKDTILKFGGWVLRRDPSRGIQIFIDRKDNLFEPAEILAFLETFGSRCRREYIEYLVLRLKAADPNLHNQLAVLYLEEIIHLSDSVMLQELTELFKRNRSTSFCEFLKKRRDPFCVSRLSFFNFVVESEHVDPGQLQQILSRQQLRYSFEECALLIAAHEHEKVLEKFLFFLEDPFVSLMNRHAEFLDVSQLVTSLPGTWSLSLLAPILQSNSLSQRQERLRSQFEVVLCKSKHLNVFLGSLTARCAESFCRCSIPQNA
ncbi:transforming growth factor, beta receptor associated protein 1 [Kappamyces sp. JEL0680]|nr:transforming growth factor, beta receptor associated protein 1 [Kappamyces sp. JEL0680]